VNKQYPIILALTIATNLIVAPSDAQQRPIDFKGRVSPQCSFAMVNDIPINTDRNLAVIVDKDGVITFPEAIPVANPKLITEPTQIGNPKPIYDSTIAANDQSIVRFPLIGNRGSVTTICNTNSTLSVTVERTATTPPTSDAKIRFADGGTGIYRYANKDPEYRETLTFNSQDVTSTIGDTAIVESNIPDPSPNSIVVYASLTAQ
jgi:hypothetical protein